MPRFDGTGPRGSGPFSGRGQGYCAVAFPESGRPYGYTGIQGRPVANRRRPLSIRGLGGRGHGRYAGRGRRARW